MTKLRLAVVGVGAFETSRARGYISTILKLSERYDLCAICDQSSDSLQQVGDKHGIGPRYTDFVEMLEGEKPDVVFILVPTDGQIVHALTAIDHGCHIITEIPYALTLPMGDAIATAAKAKGVKWEVAENVWRWPHEQLKHEIVRQGLFGKLTHARLCYNHGSYHGFNGIRMVIDKPVRRVLGYTQRIDVLPYTNYGGVNETTRVWDSGTLEFEDGVTCLYEMPPSPSPRGIQWDVEGTAGYLSGRELVLYPDGKRTAYPFEDIHEEIDGEQILSAVRIGTDPPVVWENPYKHQKVSSDDDIAKAEILTSLHRAVTENIDPVYGPANGRRDMELWIAIHASHERGNQWLDLPLTEETDVERRVREEYIRRYGADPVTDYADLLDATFGRLSVMWTIAGWL
jgi:hypothetical protein